jgi:hypothetical protein
LRDHSNDSSISPPSAAGIAALIVANGSLIVAGLVYMEWAYTNALWGYFHINPIDLGVGVPEYVLRSLSLFSLTIVIVCVAVVAATAVRA